MPIHNQFIFGPDNKLTSIGLREVGAFFPIEVHVPPQIADVMVASGQTVPNCATGIGLIDTGATITCIHEDILIGLGLKTIGVVNSGTANGPTQRNIYPARIVFPTTRLTLDLGQAMGVNLTGQEVQTTPPQPIIALLGRNLLERGIFIYNGVGGFWTITLEPS